MPKELYNEGRTVGYGTYELYVKHALSEFPDEEPATEREWLAAQLARGQSMIVHIPSEQSQFLAKPNNLNDSNDLNAANGINDDDEAGQVPNLYGGYTDGWIRGYHHIIIPLPENSKLIAANTIVGSIFYGDCDFDEHGWATRVIDYGQGISNTETKHPETGQKSYNLPRDDPHELGQSYANYSKTRSNADMYGTEQPYYAQASMEERQLLQYLKIQDGVILQAGAWNDNKHDDRLRPQGSAPTDPQPEKDLTPDFHQVPSIVITVASRIDVPFNILLTGFTNRSIVAGISGIDSGSAQQVKPENGDFLGPELYPWANKITFMTPPNAVYLLRDYLASGHSDRFNIKDTDAKKTRVNNLMIEHSDDALSTIITSSYLYSEDGVSISGPITPGGDISIASKVKDTSAQNQKFIKVTQKHSDNGHIDDATVLEHSKVIAGNGISFAPPKTDGGDVIVSSIVESLNNYLKVEQSSSSTSADGLETTTQLQASQLKASGNNIKVTPPASPGSDITITSNISGGYLIKITGGSGSTTISVDEDALRNLIKQIIDEEMNSLESRVNKLRKMMDGLTDTLNKLLAMIGPDGGKVSVSTLRNNNPSYADADFDKSFDIAWNPLTKAVVDDKGKLAIGNINVYSGDEFLKHRIITHEGPVREDLRVK